MYLGGQRKSITEQVMLNLTSIHNTFTEYLPCARYCISLPRPQRPLKFCLLGFSAGRKLSLPPLFQPSHFSSVAAPSCRLLFGTWNAFWFWMCPNPPFPGPSYSLEFHPQPSSPALSPLLLIVHINLGATSSRKPSLTALLPQSTYWLPCATYLSLVSSMKAKNGPL